MYYNEIDYSEHYMYIFDNLKLNNEHNSEGPRDHERKRIIFVLKSYT